MQTGQNPFLCFLVKTHRYHMFNKLVYYHPTFSLKSKSGRYRYFPIIDRTQLLLIFLSVLIYLSSVAYTLLSLHSGRIPLFRRYYQALGLCQMTYFYNHNSHQRNKPCSHSIVTMIKFIGPFKAPVTRHKEKAEFMLERF